MCPNVGGDDGEAVLRSITEVEGDNIGCDREDVGTGRV